MHAALTFADRVGITVPLPPHAPYLAYCAPRLDRCVSDIRPIGVYGSDIARAGTRFSGSPSSSAA
jgi:hypothetical protein